MFEGLVIFNNKFEVLFSKAYDSDLKKDEMSNFIQAINAFSLQLSGGRANKITMGKRFIYFEEADIFNIALISPKELKPKLITNINESILDFFRKLFGNKIIEIQNQNINLSSFDDEIDTLLLEFQNKSKFKFQHQLANLLGIQNTKTDELTSELIVKTSYHLEEVFQTLEELLLDEIGIIADEILEDAKSLSNINELTPTNPPLELTPLIESLIMVMMSEDIMDQNELYEFQENSWETIKGIIS